MDRMGLTSAELRAYHRALTDHTVLRRFEISVHDMNDRVLAHLTPDAVEGQIVVDRRTTPSRILNLSLLDRANATDFNVYSPAATGLHYRRQIRVEVATYVPDLGEWVSCVPFYGPVRAFDRDGDIVRITGHGRDALGMGQLWTPLGRKKGTLKVQAVRALLDRYGEDRRYIPNYGARLPRPLNMGRTAQPWPRARHLAASMNRQLFYTGRGYATMRPWPNRVVFDFDDYLASKVRTSRRLDGVINAVEVLGAKPRGRRTRVRATAVLRPGNAMSGAALAPDPGRVWLARTATNNYLRSRRDAQRVADRLLEEGARNLVSIEFDSMPVYHLDEGDMVSVEGRFFRLDRFSMPIGSGSGGEPGPVMTVGYVKRTTRG